MSIVGEKTEKILKRCQECPLNLTRKSVSSKEKRNEFLDQIDFRAEAGVAMESIMKMSCTLCPYREQFEKQFSDKPYNYFFKEKVMSK